MKKIIIDGIIGWDVYPSSIRRELENTKEAVDIEISSPGGSVFDGFEIFNLIKDYSKNKNKVNITVKSLAASIASYIAMAGDTVTAEENATIMIHNAWSPAVGDHREMRARADILEQLSNIIAKAYTKKTGKGITETRKLMDDETWLIGENMLSSGFVDSIIKTDNDGIKNENEVLLMARGRFENCISVMERSEKSKSDLKKAAALINNFVTEPEIIIEQKKEEPKTEVNKMDLEKLQARIAELEAENKALKDKNESVKAHLQFADVAPAEVLENIKNEKGYNLECAATYAKVQFKAELTKNREADNPGTIETTNTENTSDEAETAAYIAKMKARRGIK
jgi:ATP-dependent Clp protease, protease subunit